MTKAQKQQREIAGIRQAQFAAREEANEADNAYQVELDAQGIERYTKAAKGAEGSTLRELYDRKMSADQNRRELTDLLRSMDR